jgi:hypothetical protein
MFRRRAHYPLTDPRQFGYPTIRPWLAGDRMQLDQLKRREFITLIGGAAAAWPLAARAQQRERVRRIAVLMGFAESDSDAQAKVAAFQESLQNLGWVEGRNITWRGC